MMHNCMHIMFVFRYIRNHLYNMNRLQTRHQINSSVDFVYEYLKQVGSARAIHVIFLFCPRSGERGRDRGRGYCLWRMVLYVQMYMGNIFQDNFCTFSTTWVPFSKKQFFFGTCHKHERFCQSFLHIS